jgi:hypothetical protein
VETGHDPAKADVDAKSSISQLGVFLGGRSVSLKGSQSMDALDGNIRVRKASHKAMYTPPYVNTEHTIKK